MFVVERFIVWMRTAGLPNFLKFHGRIDGLKAGQYEMKIINNYDVRTYKGAKSFILMKVSQIGGDNSLLAYAFAALSFIIFVFALMFCTYNTDKIIAEELLKKDSKYAVKFK